MIIFINGSMNSGKTTTGRLLASRLGAKFLDFNDIRGELAELELEQAIPLVLNEGARHLNKIVASGKSVVASYPLSKENFRTLIDLLDEMPLFITLKPSLEVALSERGDRRLSSQEKDRIKHHYESDIVNPETGYTVDNSDTTPEETVEIIQKLIKSHQPKNT